MDMYTDLVVIITTNTPSRDWGARLGSAAARAVAACRNTLFVLASIVLLGACGDKSADDSRNRLGASHDRNRPVQIENFSLGSRLGPHGGIAMGAGEHAFANGQLIYVAMELKNAPVGTQINAIWKGPGDVVVGRETKEVRLGQRFMNFAADSAALPVGHKYRVEIQAENKSFAQLEFDLVLGAT